MYAVFSFIGTALYLLETQLLAPHQPSSHDTILSSASTASSTHNEDQAASQSASIEDEKHTLKELAESTEGLYLIFIPFIPCLIWSLVVRNKYCKLQKEKKGLEVEQEQKKGDAGDKKKEEWFIDLFGCQFRINLIECTIFIGFDTTSSASRICFRPIESPIL